MANSANSTCDVSTVGGGVLNGRRPPRAGLAGRLAASSSKVVESRLD